MKAILGVLMCIFLAACETPEGGVANKVLADFGLKERPEGYVSGGDVVFEKLDDVAAAELKRLNLEHRHGEVKFEEEGLRGQYYKEVRIYEDSQPLDVQPVGRKANQSRGYHGYINYTYRTYQSPRKPTRAEAAAESATIPTEEDGSEVYRYKFGATGAWDGGEGEPAKL